MTRTDRVRHIIVSKNGAEMYTIADGFLAPQRGPTRQQRAAMISEEVKMIQRDHPSPSFGEPDPDTLRPPGAGQTVDAEAIGENVGPGRMGENDVASREGPSAQGVGRVVEEVEDVPDSTRLARGLRSPQDDVKDPAAGGTSVMDGTARSGRAGHVARPPQEDEDADKSWTKLPTRSTSTDAFQPEQPTRHELLHSKYSPSTIAGAAFENVIEDRMKAVAEPGQLDFRDPQHLAHKMMSGQFVHFESREEKAAVEEAAKKIAARKAQELARRKGLSSGEVQPSPSNYELRPLTKAAQKTLVNKMVSGKYDYDGLLLGHVKEDTSKHFQLFVGDLSGDVTKDGLLEAFSAYGSISGAHVRRQDVDSGNARGYGFVTFRKRADAEKALQSMNGKQMGSSPIRCEWANNKNPASSAREQMYKQPVLHEVAKMALKNGTYLHQDRDRLLRKVQSLLPATAAQQAQRRGAVQEKRT